MSERRSFLRKVGYFCAIAVLLLPLSWLSAPATDSGPGRAGRAGGKLAQLRSDPRYNLGQASLGEIDPASETMKLATLGLRGVAANILWSKANHYKKTEDWTNLSATLEQITKLQPNFISVWKFQAWNLSYNVSAEFDDYRQRYYWVKRGIEFLKEGIKYNENEPRLLSDIGWFIGYKIGRADEYKQFRQLFKEDDDFHPPDRPRDRRDNWLVGKQWFLESQDAVDIHGKSLKKKGKGPNELIFFSNAPKCQINFSDAIEEEGIHGEVARRAWSLGGREWNEYGSRQMRHSSGTRIQLNSLDPIQDEANQFAERLDQLSPGLREMIEKDRRAALSEDQLKALDIPMFDRTPDQQQLATEAEDQLQVTHMDVAERIGADDPEKADEAMRLARSVTRTERKIRFIRSYRQVVNFDYWKTRCEFEQTSDALAARDLVYRGAQTLSDADLVEAKRLFNAGLAKWRIVLDAFPSIVEDSTTGDDLMDVIRDYRKLLGELDEPFPEDFVLKDIIEEHDDKREFDDVIKRPDGAEPEAEPVESTEQDATQT